jgi:outer membrane protein OmpA-like peptidoglycan-associated protein
MDLSLSYKSNNFSLDVAFPNLINESLSDDAYVQINEDNVPNVIGGVSYGFALNPKINFKPYLGIRLRETIGAEIDVMAELSYQEKFKVFGGYRDNYGATAGVGIQVSPKLLFTYNYDIGQKNVPFLADGFNEFGLHLKLRNKEDKTDNRLVEGQAVVDRIADEKIYDGDLINQADKNKALYYLGSLESGSRKEKNLKAADVYQALFASIKAQEIAKLEQVRQEKMAKEAAQDARILAQEAEAKAEEEKQKAALDKAAVVNEEKVVTPTARVSIPISDEKAEEINTTFELATKSISFQTNSIELRLSSFAALNEVFDLLSQNPAMRIALSGYTDNTGSNADNLRLSKARADRVKSYLVNKGIESSRITAEGFGNTNAIKNNAYDWGRALNRRVEIKIIKE